MTTEDLPPDDHRALERVRRLSDMVEHSLPRDDGLLNRIIDTIGDPIFVKDSSLRWVVVNEAFCDFVGYGRDELLGRSDADLLPPEQAAIFNAIDRKVLSTGVPNINEEHLTSARTGTTHVIRTTKTMFVRDSGEPILVGIFTDLTELRAAQEKLQAANEQLSRQALSDALTGLPNRRAFEECLERSVRLGQRHDHPLSVLFIDLNGFKQVNDTHGHKAGDELIAAIGGRLARAARASDFMARLGGDEFVVVSNHCDAAGARTLACRIAAVIAEPVELSAGQVSVGASIGVACFPDDASTANELIRHADTAMYYAKRTTRQAVELYRSVPPKRRSA